MSYQGDIAEDQAFNFQFTTRTFATGVPGTLGGVPVLSVYKDNGTTETTTGPTLLADFDTITGLNNVAMDTTNAFYVTGSDYSVMISTGTVGGVSVVGEVVATFSIENRFKEVDVASWLGTAVTLSGSLPDVNVEAMDANSIAVGVIASAAIVADSFAGNAITNAVLSGSAADKIRLEIMTYVMALPGQVAPSNTPTFEDALAWLYKAFRNRKDQTATLWQLYADNETTVDSKAITSDDGALAIKQEIITGA